MLNKNSLSFFFFFYFANPSVDIHFSGRLFFNFYEIAVYYPYCLLNYYLLMLFMIFSCLNIFTPHSIYTLKTEITLHCLH